MADTRRLNAFGGTDDHLAAWAVRSGRPHGHVSEPGTLALVAIALLGVAARHRLTTRDALAAETT